MKILVKKKDDEIIVKLSRPETDELLKKFNLTLKTTTAKMHLYAELDLRE